MSLRWQFLLVMRKGTLPESTTSQMEFLSRLWPPGWHTALCALLRFDSQAKLISQARPRDVLVVLIRNANMACELQKLMCAGSIIRRHHIGGCLGTNNLRLCLDTHLGNDFPYADRAFDESLLVFSPMALLNDCDYILSQIAVAEASAITVQLLPVADKIRAAAVRENRHLSYQPEYLDQQPSPTELHRIRRVLWRLYLYFEIFHPTDQHEENRYKRNVYFEKLTYRELEELECIYHHSKYQSSLWRTTYPHCRLEVVQDEYTKGHPFWCSKGMV